ncbi:MAG: aspartate aminotransferase family protein, partial [Anaerolineae bacterium]|nr:aspartate aminotransferase family protein [Anaerolineae bacterium]
LVEPGVFERIVRTTAELVMGIEAAAAEYDVPVQAGFAGTMFGVYFLKSPGAVISDYASAKENADSQRYAHVFHAMLDRGVYLAPSQFEAGFMSSTHGNLEIDITLAAIHDVFDGLNEAAAS